MVLLLSMVTSRLIFTRRSYLSCLVSSSCWNTLEIWVRKNRFIWVWNNDITCKIHVWEIWIYIYISECRWCSYLWKQRWRVRSDCCLLQHFSQDHHHLTYDRKGQVRLRSIRDDSRCFLQLSVSPATKQLTTTRADTFTSSELKLWGSYEEDLMANKRKYR